MDRVTPAAVPVASTLRVSVVIPCLNEAENIQQCVRLARGVLDDNGLSGEVIVVDNGSEDGSPELAEEAGATVVVHEPRRGYGSAYLAGFDAARGDYIVMIDADLTYDFEEIPRFIRELDGGAELVMGNRMDAVQPGAMPLLSRIGNPLMSRFLNPVRDMATGPAPGREPWTAAVLASLGELLSPLSTSHATKPAATASATTTPSRRRGRRGAFAVLAAWPPDTGVPFTSSSTRSPPVIGVFPSRNRPQDALLESAARGLCSRN